MQPEMYGEIFSRNKMNALDGSLFWQFSLQIMVTEDTCKVEMDMMKNLECKVKGFAQNDKMKKISVSKVIF